MKIKTLSLILLSSAFLFGAKANASLYGSFGLGAALNDGSQLSRGLRTSYDNSPAYSLAVGYELPLFMTDVRAEAEYLRIHPDKKAGGHASMDALMLNAYATVPLIPLVDPYVGLGMGMTRFEHENAPAVQGMLGVEYDLTFLPLTVGGEYRYFKVTEDGGARGETSKFHSNIFMLKLKYEF